MKRWTDFLYFSLSFFGMPIGSTLVGLAAKPSVWIVRAAIHHVRTFSNDWAGAFLIALVFGVRYYVFGLILPGATIDDGVPVQKIP